MSTPFSSMSISRKIGLILLFFMVMMGVGGGVGLYNATRVVGVTEILYKSYFGWLDTLSTLEKELLAQRQQLFLHISVEDEGSKVFLLEGVSNHTDAVEELIFRYRSSGLTEEKESLFREFDDSLREYQKTQAHILELSSGGRSKVAAEIYGEAGKRDFNKVFGLLTKLVDHEKHEG